MKSDKDREIGETYFVREERVILVKVVAQSDEPPGRGDRVGSKLTLAECVEEVHPRKAREAIEAIAEASRSV